MNPPRVTVLLPAYNAGDHLGEAIDSLLAQTLSDFELLVVDDGSTDGSVERLALRADPRLRIERLPRNQGIVAALNRGLDLARGEFIARMDSDDIALPERLAEQVAHLERHPELGLLGSDIAPFGPGAGPSWIRHFEPEAISVALLFENPLCHPTVLLRRSALGDLRYPADAPHAEEYALWVLLAARSRLANLPRPLLRYRSHPGQISKLRSIEQCQSIERIIRGQLRDLGLDPSPPDLRLHLALSHGFYPLPGLASALDRWIRRLEQANRTSGRHDAAHLREQLASRRAHALRTTAEALARMTLRRRLTWRLHCLLRSVR